MPNGWSKLSGPSAIADAERDPDLALALIHTPAADRPALAALFALDAAFGQTLASASQPALGEIRLAWWREALEALDNAPPPAEPRLADAARLLLPRGIRGAELAAVEGGWRPLFDEFPWTITTAEALLLRGRLLFGLGARLLGCDPAPLEPAGGLWALVDVARGCSDAASRRLLLGQALVLGKPLRGMSLPSTARPLGMLTTAAMRDADRGEPVEQRGAPGRVAAMLGHRWTGRLPRGA